MRLLLLVFLVVPILSVKVEDCYFATIETENGLVMEVAYSYIYRSEKKNSRGAQNCRKCADLCESFNKCESGSYYDNNCVLFGIEDVKEIKELEQSTEANCYFR